MFNKADVVTSIFFPFPFSISFGIEVKINKIQIITKKKFDVDQLDDFRKYNLEIFNHENNYYNKYDVFDTLSLIILSLLDLNVLEIEDIGE